MADALGHVREIAEPIEEPMHEYHLNRRELLLEMERRRRLDAIYEKHKELGIEVEKPEE